MKRILLFVLIPVLMAGCVLPSGHQVRNQRDMAAVIAETVYSNDEYLDAAFAGCADVVTYVSGHHVQQSEIVRLCTVIINSSRVRIYAPHAMVSAHPNEIAYLRGCGTVVHASIGAASYFASIPVLLNLCVTLMERHERNEVITPAKAQSF